MHRAPWPEARHDGRAEPLCQGRMDYAAINALMPSDASS